MRFAVCRERPAGLVKPEVFAEVGAEGLPSGAVAVGIEIVGVEEERNLVVFPAAGDGLGAPGRVRGTVAAGADLGCIMGVMPGC